MFSEVPLKGEGVEIDSDALSLIVTETHGYPYFVQEWGKHTWMVADESQSRARMYPTRRELHWQIWTRVSFVFALIVLRQQSVAT